MFPVCVCVGVGVDVDVRACVFLTTPFLLAVQEQQAMKLKNEKLKIAMMKLKEASVHKVSSH